MKLLIMPVQVCVLLLCFLSSTNGLKRNDKVKAPDVSLKTETVHDDSPEMPKSGQQKMTPPLMTEEEEGSRQLPRKYRCSGCAAIAYQLQKQFSVAERKFKRGRRLEYSDVLEITEDVCEKKLKGYGLKSVQGEKVLSGEGLLHDKDMGIMEAGGKWEVRLKTLCGELIELFEEEDIYEQYVNRGDFNLAVTLCANYCTLQEAQELKHGRKDEL